MIATFRNLGVLALLAMGGACERWGPVLPEGTIWDHPLGGHLAAGPDGDLFVLAEASSSGLRELVGAPEGLYPPAHLVRIGGSDGRIRYARPVREMEEFSTGTSLSVGPEVVVGLLGSTNQYLVVRVRAEDGERIWSVAQTCLQDSFFTRRVLVAAAPDGSVVSLACVGYEERLEKRAAEDGRLLWSRLWRSGGSGYVSDLEVGGDGSITLVARFYSNIDVGLGPLLSEGEGNLVARFSGTDGTPVWSTAVTGNCTNEPRLGLAADGGLAIVGAFVRSITAGPHRISAPSGPGNAGGGQDVYVARLAADGTFQWVRALGGPDFDTGGDVVVLPSGAVVASLNFHDYIAYAGAAYRSRDGANLLIAAFEPSGRPRVPRALLGSSSPLSSFGLAAAPSGRIYATNGSVVAALPPP